VISSKQNADHGPQVTPAGHVLLHAKNLGKVFGGAVALSAGSLIVNTGEIHALLGENGAGKSTLIKCLAGTPPPDAGEIAIDGYTLPPNHTARHATDAGLAFIHQETALIESLSVEENIALTNGYQRRGGLINWGEVRRFAHAAIARMGVDLDPSRLVAELPPATRTVIAIAAALARSARILVLDEPTANLAINDVQALFRVLRRVKATGNAVVFVSHRLDEVFELCDNITVLRDGKTVGSTAREEITKDDLVALICGRRVVVNKKAETATTGEIVLAATKLQGSVVSPVSFSVRRGEIVGLTGLSDAGHYEIGEMVFGVKPVRSGSLTLSGKPFEPASPAEAIRHGVSYVPPDRNLLGLAREMSIAENLFFNPLRGSPILGPLGTMSSDREHKVGVEILHKFSVRPPIPSRQVVTLSGGNAQKVLVARWLFDVGRLLIVNDVSVGVDVRAREEIYSAIRRAASAGTAVLVITSDFEEIETLCARALVFTRGIHQVELSGADVNVAQIAACLAANKPKEAK
jgi:ribose transport system ATP-binding protein